MALLKGITYSKATQLVQVLTRDAGNVSQYATAAVCLDAFNQAVKHINGLTRSVTIDNLSNPVIYQGAPIITNLSLPATATNTSITVQNLLNITAGMSMTISGNGLTEVVTVAGGYVAGTQPVTLSAGLVNSYPAGSGVISNTRLYDFPTGFSAV